MMWKNTVSVFRDAEWITYERTKLWGTAFGIAWFFYLLFDAWTHSALGFTDAKGVYMGRDFINYWSGAHLAADGQAKAAYDINSYYAFQKLHAGALAEFKIYSYPPVLMLLTQPLALCSFLTGFLLWTLAGYTLCAGIFSRYVPMRLALAAAIAAPACLLNMQSGQNGFFTLALFAGALILLERKPMTAGVLIGLLCYKPQLGLLIPLALMAGGYWRSFIAAGLTIASLAIASTILYGADVWPAFAAQMELQSGLLPRSNLWWHRMPTVFCSLRNFHVPVPLAWMAQCASALCAAACVVKVWRGNVPSELKHAILILAAFLATPYAWDYDMPVVVFALLCVVREAQRTGWQPWEKFAWMATIIMPLVVTALAQYTPVQPDAFILWWVFWLTFRRAQLAQKS